MEISTKRWPAIKETPTEVNISFEMPEQDWLRLQHLVLWTCLQEYIANMRPAPQGSGERRRPK